MTWEEAMVAAVVTARKEGEGGRWDSSSSSSSSRLTSLHVRHAAGYLIMYIQANHLLRRSAGRVDPHALT